MDIIQYLKPKYVLMENVVDIVNFFGGYLGRLALGHLVAMNKRDWDYVLVVGCYGLPQFRMCAFFWGACSTEKLPQSHYQPMRWMFMVKFLKSLRASYIIHYKQKHGCKMGRPNLA
ncbi:hypothetical protein IFM89_013699 [Coptis chinensis]|uniref:Uncharacterized protein n=1 Tax=Coptis chinensis TaxID=261450 RepID=A0A835GZ82_9MAGN|nr:hypothetical protein IFM89_013699 [Coptis chinensis]